MLGFSYCLQDLRVVVSLRFIYYETNFKYDVFIKDFVQHRYKVSTF